MSIVYPVYNHFEVIMCTKMDLDSSVLWLQEESQRSDNQRSFNVFLEQFTSWFVLGFSFNMAMIKSCKSQSTNIKNEKIVCIGKGVEAMLRIARALSLFTRYCTYSRNHCKSKRNLIFSILLLSVCQYLQMNEKGWMVFISKIL